MLDRVSTLEQPGSIESGRTAIRRSERLFGGGNLALCARALWPSKTAAHLAAAAGCTERAAEFYLAGHREWSAAAQAAVIRKILN